MKQRTQLKKKSTHSMKNHKINRQDLLVITLKQEQNKIFQYQICVQHP